MTAMAGDKRAGYCGHQYSSQRKKTCKPKIT
jgi:hypothetical protein